MKEHIRIFLTGLVPIIVITLIYSNVMYFDLIQYWIGFTVDLAIIVIAYMLGSIITNKDEGE